jgi:hypothetical protein
VVPFENEVLIRRKADCVSVRKPGDQSWESWVDRQIREARERGEFDNLPGAGKPLPDMDRPYDELWWVRRKLKEENLSFLPPALEVRKKLDEAREQIGSVRSEREVRQIVADINERIREVNRSAAQGPAPPVMPLDEERIVSEWRERRASQDR